MKKPQLTSGFILPNTLKRKREKRELERFFRFEIGPTFPTLPFRNYFFSINSFPIKSNMKNIGHLTFATNYCQILAINRIRNLSIGIKFNGTTFRSTSAHIIYPFLSA